LKGKSIAVMENSESFLRLQAINKEDNLNLKFVPKPDCFSILSAVESGQADGGLVNRYYAMEKEREFTVKKTHITLSIPPKLYFATLKNNNSDLLLRVDEHLKICRKQPESPYNQALEKWLGFGEVKKITPLRAYIAIAIVFALAVIFGIFYIITRAMVRKKTLEISESNMMLKREIAEHDKTMSMLRESESLYRTLIDNLNDAFVLFIDGKLTLVNKKYTELFGFTPEHYGMDVTEVAKRGFSKNPELVNKRIHQVNETSEGALALNEFTAVDEKGREVHLMANTSVLQIEGKKASISLVRDLTEFRSLEKQFIQSQKMEMVGRLTGGIAHDFNNLLTVITGYISMAMFALEDNHPVLGDLEQVEKAAVKASNLTRQLLTFSRKTAVEPKIVNINPLINEIAKMLKRLLGENIELNLKLEPNIHPVNADQALLDQVFINMSVNARDAMPIGGKLTISTRNAYIDSKWAEKWDDIPEGEYIVISVSDTGCGMTEEVKAKIFEPFFTTKEAGKGTGLGLSVCYGIVKMHNGRITVYSEPGKGTNFNIYLPKALGEVKEEIIARDKTLPTGSETILIVEDDEDIRGYVANILKKLGYKMFVAADGKEALELCKHSLEPFDLVISDVMMPVVNGVTFAEELMKFWKGIKFIFISGYTDSVLDGSVLKEEYRLLRKPFTPMELAKCIREELDRR
jgi:PAS domain S-box-containing protein